MKILFAIAAVAALLWMMIAIQDMNIVELLASIFAIAVVRLLVFGLR
jgi:hypothetical protein